MADPHPHPTLRELRAHVLDARTLTVLILIGAVLTLVAPFGTDRALPVWGLATFWIGIVLGTYVIGMATDLLLRPRCAALPVALRVAVIAGATGLATAIPVELLTNILFGWPTTPAEVLPEIAPKFAIGVAASLGIQIAAGPGAAAPDRSDAPRPPALLDRLPLDKRGPLLSLSVEDHYVRVRTTRGEEMLLMRLSDAMREAAPTPGLQVHRSHWVAAAAVTAARRDGDRAVLTLSHGGDIPVSRSHIQALKDARLLPRSSRQTQ